MLSSDDPNTHQDNLHEIYETVDGVERAVCINDYSHYDPVRGETYGHNVMYDCKYDEYGGLTAYCAVDYHYEGTEFDPGGVWNWHTHGWLYKAVNTYNWRYWDETLWQWQWASKVLSQNAYTYDAVGNRLTNAVTVRDENDQLTPRTEGYGYDELSRLGRSTTVTATRKATRSTTWATG